MDDAISSTPTTSTDVVIEKWHRVLSGIQPSGSLHLGNYFGAMKQHLEAQHHADTFYFVANLHSLTSSQDPVALRRATREVAAAYLALGLDAKKSCLYIQSAVPEVTELAWYFSVVVGMGDLERMTAYKDKTSRGLASTVGLFSYPILMAADIAIVNANIVPVGEDQRQHLELARRLVSRFNTVFNTSVLTEPLTKLNATSIVPGLDGRKMSKSYGNTIALFASPADIAAQVAGVVTSSLPAAASKDPAQCNLFALLKLMADSTELDTWSRKYVNGGLRYSEVKARVCELHASHFGDAYRRYQDLLANTLALDTILADGATRVRRISQDTMMRVRDAVGSAAPLQPTSARGGGGWSSR